MKIVHVSAHDVLGGAARAAYGLHEGLTALGQESQMFVLDRRSDAPSIVAFDPPRHLHNRVLRRFRQERIRQGASRYRRSRPVDLIGDSFNDDRSRHDGADLVAQLPHCDVVNLHVVVGFVDYRSFMGALPDGIPLVWTLHDMNVFTGGCHYDLGCDRFVDACGACPQLGSSDPHDLSHAIWKRKCDAYAGSSGRRSHFVAVSNWIAEQAQRSSLLARLPVSTIHPGLDVDAFAPRDRQAARAALGIPADARVLLFVADSLVTRRKGFALLVEVLNAMEDTPGLVLLSVGDNRPALAARVPHVHLDFLDHDRLLSMVYSAADVFVAPSQQEAFGLTVLEAMACGTPIAAFATGGIPDMVRPGETGELAVTGDTGGLRAAIVGLLGNEERRTRMGVECRRFAVQRFSRRTQAARYLQLYESVMR